MKIFSKILGILFHPLTIVLYSLLLLQLCNPYEFIIENEREKVVIFTLIGMLTVGFPVLAIALIHFLEIMKGMAITKQQERIVPLILAAMFYLWLFINIRSNTYIPEIFISIVLGATIAIFIAFFINNFSRIHLHSIGIGSLIMVIVVYMLSFPSQQFPVKLWSLGTYVFDLSLFLIIAILLGGILAFAAKQFHAYNNQDIYGGALVGVISQVLAFMIIL